MPTPLTVLPQIFYSGGWQTVPVYAEASATVIERGYTDEGTIRPTKMSMRVNDAAAVSLNPSRATSPMYGTAGRAVPVAISCQGSVRAWLESTAMDPDETQSFNQAAGRGMRWLDIDAGGPLFRLGQWSEIVRSTMFRQFSTQYTNLIGYWPGEEDRNATILSTIVGQGASQSGITFGDTDAPAGSAASWLGSATTNVVLSPKDASLTAGFQIFWSSKVGTPPTSPTQQTLIKWRAQSLLWQLDMDNLGFRLRVFDAGAVIGDNSYVWGSTPPGDWISFRCKCYQSAGNIVNELAWYTKALGPLTVAGITQTFAGTINRALSSIRVEPNTMIATTRFCHMGALTTVADNLQSITALRALVGFEGEYAADRFLRLLAEAGIARSVLGTVNLTQTMGAQKPDTLMNLLKEIAATEDALIFDRRDAIELRMRTRRHRFNQTPALTLTYPADIMPPLKERLDFTGVQNLVSIDNKAGGTAVKELTSGLMSTAAYPAGIGPVKGGAFPDVDVNVDLPDTQLPVIASWYLSRGTVAGPRFPQVVIEVGLKATGLQTAVKTLDIGDRITITGRLPDVIDLQVIGIREEIQTHKWIFTLTCVPNDAFNVGIYDTTRYAAKAQTVQTAMNTVVGSLIATTTDPNDYFGSANLPYDIWVAGERMRVTAVGAVSGTGPYLQTLTVTRSINGVVKSQVINTPIQAVDAAKYGW